MKIVQLPAFFNLLKERRKPIAPLNIQKTTNEPTLDFPYAAAKPSKQTVKKPPSCRSRASPRVRKRAVFSGFRPCPAGFRPKIYASL
jgi:hypothetical protein